VSESSREAEQPDVEKKGFEIPAYTARVGEITYHVVPPDLMLLGEALEQASSRLLAAGWKLEEPRPQT
jgi:hypothetical protein